MAGSQNRNVRTRSDESVKNRIHADIRHIRIVVFDCDGVMFDTTEANKAYYNHLLQRFQRPVMNRAQFAYTHMHTVDEALAFLFDDAALLEAVQAYRMQMNYVPFLKYMVIEPGLRPLLNRLRPRYRTAIATNRTDTMDHVLKSHDLEKSFDLVVTAFDVVHPKPHPEQLHKILGHFGLQPVQAIYIGDSELDERAAGAAGVAFVAYANRALRADFHIKRLKELEDILEL
jgi:HAD superfamily hydrolase (TIGR01509 family)